MRLDNSKELSTADQTRLLIAGEPLEFHCKRLFTWTFTPRSRDLKLGLLNKGLARVFRDLFATQR